MNSRLDAQQTDYPIRIVIQPSLFTLSLEGSTAAGSERSPRAQSRGSKSIEDSDLVGKDPCSTFQPFSLQTLPNHILSTPPHPKFRRITSLQKRPRGPLPLCPPVVLLCFRERSSFATTLQICTFVFNHFHYAPPATLFFSHLCIVAGGWGAPPAPSQLGNAQGGIRKACGAA